MVSVAILGLTAFGGIGAFTMLNTYTASLRNISSAKALCQERIEQASTMSFNPPTGVLSVPAYFKDATGAYPPLYILGTSGNWTTATPPYTSVTPVSFTAAAAGIQTSSEPVDVFVTQDSGTTTSVVSGTRTTSIKLMGTSSGGTTPYTVLFTVQVSYSFKNNDFDKHPITNTYTMSTLRALDIPR